MFSFIQWPSSVLQVIWIERMNCTRFVAVAYNRATISVLPPIICGKSQKISPEWPVCGPNYESRASRKEIWKYNVLWELLETYHLQMAVYGTGLFQKGRQCHTLQYVTAIFHFSPKWKLSRIITASSGVCSTFTEQFCGTAHWNLVTWAYILITTIGHTDCPSTVDWSFFSQKCIIKRLGVRKQRYKDSQRLCWSLKSFGLWRRIDW